MRQDDSGLHERVRKSINNAMDCINSAIKSRDETSMNSHLVSAVTHLELAIYAIQVRIKNTGKGGEKCFLE